MRFGFSKLWCFLLCLSACAVPQLLVGKKKEKADIGPNEQRRAVHTLNRLTFGPRPGDVQQVMAMGVDRWIDLQLHPEKISDSMLEARLSTLRIPRMNPKEIAEEFPDNGLIKQVLTGRRPMPSDPARRAIYQVQIARLEARRDKKEQKEVASAATASPSASDGAKTAEELAAAPTASPDPPASAEISTNSMNSSNGESVSTGLPPTDAAAATFVETKMTPAEEEEANRREERLYADLKVQGLLGLPPDDRFKKVLSMSPDEQLAFADSLRGGKGQEFVADMNPKQRETLLAMNNPHTVVVDELDEAKLLRAFYSERQLEEVMTDFWMNHFSVFINKGPERYFLAKYEQRAIRPHALGKFEDLLVATAKSPAMLFYLDNWLSVGPNSMQALGVPERPTVRYGRYGRPRMYPRRNGNGKRKQNSGLNENYGRELLELHTLSVNGGYSQRDVTEVAKVFTGWTIEKPNDGGEFRYDPRKHEPGPKFVLGHHIKPKGEDEGKEVLHLLATSPQTAHFISLKLAQRFVADDPPPALVDRMAKTFEKKKGDIREVLSTMFHSPEFWADGSYRAKVKTPFEFVVSAVRATGADVQDALPLIRQLNNMGMPLYGAQPPTGYSMKAQAWVSSSALLNRMNFALSFTSGKMRGVNVDVLPLIGEATDVPTTLSALEARLLDSEVSKQTHDSILARTESPPNSGTTQKGTQHDKRLDVNGIAGLLLGSPEFQRR